jgi:hypothetical protein
VGFGREEAAVVEGTETIDGRECVVIAATKDYGVTADGTPYGSWYVADARTYNPVEWRMTRDGGKVVNIRFDVYETLPADDERLVLLDLAAQHPGAAFSTSLQVYQEAMAFRVLNLGLPRAPDTRSRPDRTQVASRPGSLSQGPWSATPT